MGWLYSATGHSVLLVGLRRAQRDGWFVRVRAHVGASDPNEATLVVGSGIVIAAAVPIVVLTWARLAYRADAVDATA